MHGHQEAVATADSSPPLQPAAAGAEEDSMVDNMDISLEQNATFTREEILGKNRSSQKSRKKVFNRSGRVPKKKLGPSFEQIAEAVPDQ